jgi:hypothetical protein
MTGAARRQSNWTAEEDRRLLELVEAGKSWVHFSETQAAEALRFATVLRTSRSNKS